MWRIVWRMSNWAWWVIAAVGLVVGEVLTLDLTLVMIAAGALAGGGVAAAGGGLALQLIAAAVVALLMLVAVRPIVKRHLRVPRELRTGTAALVGQRALALQPVTGDAGQVKIGGEVWSARSFDGSPIPADARVEVISIDGATAVVINVDESG